MSTVTSRRTTRLTGKPATLDHAVMWRIQRPVGFLLIAVLLGAVLSLAVPSTTLWQRVLQDATHGPVFAGVAMVLLAMRRVPAGAPSHAWRDHASAWIWAIALGAFTEIVQLVLPDRDASWMDVVRDAAGAAFGLAVVAIAERDRRLATPLQAGYQRWAWPVALAMFTLLAWRPLQCAQAYGMRAAAFPTLGPLGSAADREFAEAPNARLTRAMLPGAWRRPGETSRAFRVDFRRGADRPAFELSEGSPDWRGYSVLALDLTNPGARPLRFSLRVLDERHDWTFEDRFNLPLIVPARSRITVRVSLAAVAAAPARRPMDLSAIADLLLFHRGRPAEPGSFYVSRVWLE